MTILLTWGSTILLLMERKGSFVAVSTYFKGWHVIKWQMLAQKWENVDDKMIN
jgi:hypothetical protein